MIENLTAERLVEAVKVLRDVRGIPVADQAKIPPTIRHLLVHTGMLIEEGGVLWMTESGYLVIGLHPDIARKYGRPATDPEYPICTANSIVRYVRVLRDVVDRRGMHVDIANTCRDLEEIKAVEALGLIYCVSSVASRYWYRGTVAGYQVAGYPRKVAEEMGVVGD